MSLRRPIIFVFFIFLKTLIFSVPYDLIPAGDPVLEDLRFLSLQSGNPVLSFTAPLSPDEVRIFLDTIDSSQLSLPAQNAYERVENRLNPAAPISLVTPNFALLLNLNSTAEAALRFNSDVSWQPDYPKISPVLAAPFRFFFADCLQLYFEPSLNLDPGYYRDSGNFDTNIPGKFEEVDMTVPLRGYISAGGSWWNFQLGRDRLSFGSGITGNLAISDNPAYYEFARFTVFSKYFRYSMMVNQMPLVITNDIYSGIPGPNTLMESYRRYLYLHRMDFILFRKVSIGLTEGVMAGDTGLELRYVNPFAVFHSMFTFWDYPDWDGGPGAPAGTGDMNGSLFSAEINWSVIKSFSVYGQFVMNQIATAYKLGQWPDRPPNGLGYLAGVNYSRPFNNWASVFYLEFIYTDPYLYMNPSPFSSLIQMRNLGYSPGRHQYSFLGYPRDRISLALGTRFFNGDKLEINGEFSWVSAGEHGIYWDWEKSEAAYMESTPSGIPQNTLTFGASARWKPFSFLALNGSAACTVTLNNRHIDGVNAAGGQATVSVSFTY
ncbi:MAG: hypothetical protein FWD78_04330 [Treponema sp.]|nr:hypothetical protein [Treponema sp.]